MAKCIKRAGIVFFVLVLSLLLVLGTICVTGVVENNSNSIVNTNSQNNALTENNNTDNDSGIKVPSMDNVDFDIPKAYFEYELKHTSGCENALTCNCLQDAWLEATQKAVDTGKNVKVVLMTDWIAKADSEYNTSFGKGAGFYFGRIAVPDITSITLDLNGHTIDRKLKKDNPVDFGNAIYLYPNSVLNLLDSKYDAQKVYDIYNNYTVGSEEQIQKLRDLQFGKITGASRAAGSEFFHGGGILLDNAATLNLYSGVIAGNYADMGGAICAVSNSNVNIFNGLIMDNSAIQIGGLYIQGNLNVYGGVFYNNIDTSKRLDDRISIQGGAIGINSPNGVCNIFDGIFANNTAAGRGGALYVGNVSELNICGGLFENNYAGIHAGAFYINLCPNANIFGGKIVGNSCADWGGAILVQTENILNLYGGTIENNSASEGGAIFAIGGVNLCGGVVSQNKATAGYGGIYSRISATISGGARVYDNKVNDINSDLYFVSKINITGNLAENGMAYIGIDLNGSSSADYNGKVLTSGYVSSGNTLIPSNFFFINNDGYGVTLADEEMVVTTETLSSNLNWYYNDSVTTKPDITVEYSGSEFVIKSDFSEIVDANSNIVAETFSVKEVGTYMFYANQQTANQYLNPSFSITITPKPVDIACDNTELQYNGFYQSPTIYLKGVVNNDYCTAVVNGSGRDIGNYIANVYELVGADSKNYSLPFNAQISFSIVKAQLQKPNGNQIFEYDGSKKEFLPTGYDSKIMNITGNTATNVGSYTATISLKDKANYEWVDKTNNDVTIKYAITLTPQVEEGEYKFIYIDDEGYRKTYKQGGIVHGVNDSSLNGGRLVLGNIAPNTSVKRFVETLGYDTSKIVIKDSAEKEIYVNGVPVDQSTYDKRFELAVGTGWRVEYTTTGGTEIIYLSVLGDINGDGRISASDCAYLRELANDKVLYDNLNAEIKLASLIINKGKVTSADSEIILNVINQKLTMDLFF